MDASNCELVKSAFIEWDTVNLEKYWVWNNDRHYKEQLVPTSEINQTLNHVSVAIPFSIVFQQRLFSEMFPNGGSHVHQRCCGSLDHFVGSHARM